MCSTELCQLKEPTSPCINAQLNQMSVSICRRFFVCSPMMTSSICVGYVNTVHKYLGSYS